jgi:hypothetical protein
MISLPAVASCSILLAILAFGKVGLPPQELMTPEIKAVWEQRPTGQTYWHDHSCDSPHPLIAHSTGWHTVTFMLQVVSRSADRTTAPLPRFTVWFREPFWDDVLKVDVKKAKHVFTRWDAFGEKVEREKRTVDRRESGLPITLKLKVSTYRGCEGGEVVASVGTYSQVGLVTARGCADMLFLVDRSWSGERVIELDCGGTSSSFKFKPQQCLVFIEAFLRSPVSEPFSWSGVELTSDCIALSLGEIR